MYKIMRSKSPEKRGRQKVARPPMYGIEDEYNAEAMAVYFQISVSIIEGRKLAWSNPQSVNSYVIVALGKKKHRTCIRRNMVDPIYRETFVFEMYANIRDLQQSRLWLAVMEPRCCAAPRILGEVSVDLGAVWAEPNHQIFHKWAQLSLPQNPNAGPVGFLQIDVSIIFRGEVQVMPTLITDDKLEQSLLLPSGCEQQCANYQITVYGAFGLPNGTQYPGDKRLSKSPSTFVRVSYCGLVAQTATQHRTNSPLYSEQITLVEMFPNINQLVRLEVCSADGCFNRVIGSTTLDLGEISHDGENGFLPTFGPSFIHMYGTSFTGTLGLTGDDGPFYRGALLVAHKTIVPYYQQTLRSITMEPVEPIRPENLWLMEDFCIFCPILEVSMLDRRIAGKNCGLAITIGDITSNSIKPDEEFSGMQSEIRSRKMHYTGCLEVFKSQPVYGYLDFCNAFPVLQFASTLPDFRFRMYKNNMIYGIVSALEQTLNAVENRLTNFNYSTSIELLDEINKAIDDAAGNILKFLDILQYSSPAASSNEKLVRQYSTELDRKQLDMQKKEIENIHRQISTKMRSCSYQSLPSVSRETKDVRGARKAVKLLLADTMELTRNLKNLIYKGWPDIIIWLLNEGSRVAYTKISPADVIYSVIPEQSGKDCGRIQSVYLKPLKCPKHATTVATSCSCFVGKVELLLWMGLHRQMPAFDSCLPNGFKLKVKDYYMCIKSSAMMVECRAFIYKSKLNGDVISNEVQTFVRINALNSVKETQVKCKTLTPVWNQVLKIHRMMFMSPDRLVHSPPIVLVEVNNTDLSGKTELLGRFQVTPAVDVSSQSFATAPKLQWYDLFRGKESVGQVLMSVQMLQVPEKLLKSTMYSPVGESFIAGGHDPIASDCIEPLPVTLLPISTSYKVDVYWWGLRDVNITKKPCVVLEIEELSIKSEIISDKKPNCNFTNGRTAQIFQAPLHEAYCPPLSIKLYDSSTYGRTLYLGTNVVKNPNKYLVDWLPKTEREASLKRKSITSSDFYQVNQRLFVKNRPQLSDACSNYTSCASINTISKSKVKCALWQRLFKCSEPNEEEYSLLPVFTKRKLSAPVANTSSEKDVKDWWLRYLKSLKDNSDEADNSGNRLVIYESELECQPGFSKFKDWCASLKLYNGKKTGEPARDRRLTCGLLKAGLAIYRWPPPDDTTAVAPSGVDLNKGFFDDHPSNEPAKFLVRVYIVKGLNLKTKEFTGNCNPYIILSCGRKYLGTRNSFVENTFNPIFGKFQEFRCSLPEDYLLTISLYDYDTIPPDQLIGSTTIDLENRIYSKHRARVGLSSEYSQKEPDRWRDCVKPSIILEEICAKNYLPPPIFSNASTLIVNGVEYKDIERDKSNIPASERKENLCLSILNKWHTLPICGYHLVPEHVETRALYNPDRPGIEQGKIQMWLDIFPLDTSVYIPPPVDITPRKVEDYELRLTIFSVRDIPMHSPLLGRNISDVYVRAWIGSTKLAQNTDVHFQCQDGTASFNWRMIFHFQFQRTIKKLVFNEKGPFTEYEENIPPILIVQLMDNDAPSDDFIGSVTLNLNTLPRSSRHAQECTLDIMNNSKKVDLFSARNLRAWWPLSTIDQDMTNAALAGKVDLEITLLPKEKAVLMPVGLAREPPFPLPDPIRPRRISEGLYKKIRNAKVWKQRRGIVAIILTTTILIFLVVLYFEIPSIFQLWYYFI